MREVALRGHPAAPGAALGPAWTRVDSEDGPPGDADYEWVRVERGLALVVSNSTRWPSTGGPEGHDADADIVDSNRMMANDALLAAASPRLPGRLGATRDRRGCGTAIAALANPTTPRSPRAPHLRRSRGGLHELANGNGVAPLLLGAIILAEDLA